MENIPSSVWLRTFCKKNLCSWYHWRNPVPHSGKEHVLIVLTICSKQYILSVCVEASKWHNSWCGDVQNDRHNTWIQDFGGTSDKWRRIDHSCIIRFDWWLWFAHFFQLNFKYYCIKILILLAQLIFMNWTNYLILNHFIFLAKPD